MAGWLARWSKVLKRWRKLRNADVVVISHAKSGRTWLATMMSHVYHRRFGISERELLKFDNFHQSDPRVPRILFSHDNRKDGLHSPLFSPRDFRGKKVVLLVRDPRDIAVSAFFQSLRNARKGTTAAHAGDPLYAYVADYKLPLVISFLQRWRDQRGQIEACLVVRYEDLRARPESELARIFDFIEGSANDEEIADAVAFASFETMKQREASNFFASDKLRPGDPQNPDSFKVRRGKVGGYRGYFDDQQLERLETLMAKADLGAFGYLPERANGLHCA